MTTTDTLRRLGARPAASLPRRGLLAVFLALALIAAACGGDSQDTAGEEQTTAQQPDPEVPDPDPEPEPEAPDPEPEPEVADPEPDPEPEPEAPDPDPEPEAADPEPEPEAADPEPEVADPEPEPEAADPEPEPEAPDPDPEPEPEAADPEPEPEVAEPEPEPEAAEPESEVAETEPEPEAEAAEPEPEPEPEVEVAEPDGDETGDDDSSGSDDGDGSDDGSSSDGGDDGTGGDDSAVNQAPTFDEGDSAARGVVENASPGDPVGDPVEAGDGDGDLLIYSLSGADAASFAIDFLTGQITTRAALDHDTKATYTLTVEVSDSKDADGNTEQPRQTDDTIEVTVTVDPWRPTLTVYLQGDTSTPVTSVDGAGPQTFTLVGKGWTGLHTTPAAGGNSNPVLLLTSCLVRGQGGLDFFRQCDSDGLHTFASVRSVDEGSQDLSSLYASDDGLRALAATTLPDTTLEALAVASDGSFRLDMPVDVPAGGVIIIAAVGNVDTTKLLMPDLITIIKAVTVEISA